MSFFDKNQDVIDIKLTPYGKGLLARGFFKPAFYRFFDDDILYNLEKAGQTEEQNRSEERILESQRLKTQHLSVGVDTRFDHNQDLIHSGTLRSFVEITKRQDPLIADKMLKYPLEESLVNSNKSPKFELKLHGHGISSTSTEVNVEGITLPVPQINITASYTIVEDRYDQVPEEDIENRNLSDSERYIDLISNSIEFIDKSKLVIDGEDLIIDLEELETDYGLDNFEVEFFEIIEDGKKTNIIKLEEEEKVKNFFTITTDSMITELDSLSRGHRRKPRGRN
tara:strand:- start:239 stop:1084 length:846 start_codon:yes stop_codon:yes gene_type:complete